MSGFNEIIQWVDNEIIFDSNDDPLKAFDDISNIFTNDNRLPLADILQEDTPKFMEFIESRLESKKTYKDIQKLLQSDPLEGISRVINLFFDWVDSL